jgi:hypothetical protein
VGGPDARGRRARAGDGAEGVGHGRRRRVPRARVEDQGARCVLFVFMVFGLLVCLLVLLLFCWRAVCWCAVCCVLRPPKPLYFAPNSPFFSPRAPTTHSRKNTPPPPTTTTPRRQGADVRHQGQPQHQGAAREPADLQAQGRAHQRHRRQPGGRGLCVGVWVRVGRGVCALCAPCACCACAWTRCTQPNTHNHHNNPPNKPKRKQKTQQKQQTTKPKIRCWS